MNIKIFQTGLMWRQTGPIIISMTYMIIDVLVFLFIFVIVYISFTLVTVYVYEVYDNDRTQFFNSHKSAFKLFWWSLIRTGNPHFPNIREFEKTLHLYNSTCIGDILNVSKFYLHTALVKINWLAWLEGKNKFETPTFIITISSIIFQLDALKQLKK